MFRNYLTIAVRNLVKRKGYTLLNIFGLTIGMSCCLLIFHYVSYEKSYDTFQDKGGQIVRVRLDSYQKGKLAYKSATSYPAIAPTMKKDFPEVKQFCRIIDAEGLLANDEKNVKFNETKGYFADPAFLQMFNIQLARGEQSRVLDGPDKMIISENMAKKYFGNDNPVGKRLISRGSNSSQPLEVAGVFKNYPANSHLIIEYLISYSTLGKINLANGDSSNAVETSWGWYDFYDYVQLQPGADYKKLEAKLPAFSDKYINNQEWARKNNYKTELHLIPLSDIHLYSNYNQEAEVNGNGQSVGFLFLIALFIIGIAWINFINLATARSIERAREVGMRKVLGAMRKNLIGQFLIESFLMNLVSLALSMLAFYLLLPAFDYFTGRDTVTGVSLTGTYWFIFWIVFISGTLLSGLYPAFVLSGFLPVTVLKGTFKNTAGGMGLRKSLIVLQFITSVVLIAGTIIVYQQVSYMRNQKLGFNINQTLVLQGAGSIADSLYKNTFQPFKNDVLQLRGVKQVTASSNVMGQEIYWTNGLRRIGVENETSVTLYHLGIDEDFIPSYNLELIAGQNFKPGISTVFKSVMLNNKAVELLGFKDAKSAVHTYLKRGRDSLRIEGVVADFHHQGLQKAIDPMVILYLPNVRSYYSLKVETGNVQQSVAAIQGIWNKHFPADPFNYFFLDDSFNNQYKADQLFGKVFGVFAFLAILIACFGLLGLSAYNVLQRTKEIGIRKVLGASVQSILLLLSKDFLKLIILALALAIPIGWYVMNMWLQDFAYRINIAWWVFAAAGIIALLIALITIGLQALRTVTDNPVKSLRTE